MENGMENNLEYYEFNMLLVSLPLIILLKAHRRDRENIRRHLADSHGDCHLLRKRMEELINFLEELMSVTPSRDHGSTRRERMTLCLNKSRDLLAEIAARQVDHGRLYLCMPYHSSLSLCPQESM